MPAAEAVAVANEEQNSYELAFHVLPTVAEGEVPDVYTDIKNAITNLQGAIFAEEEPQRIDLAYDIIQNVEGRNRHFTSAYFGWVRFTLPSEATADLTEAMDEHAQVLRHLLIKLSKLEVENPVYYHQLMAEVETKVTNVDEDGAVTAPVATPETDTTSEVATDEDTSKTSTAVTEAEPEAAVESETTETPAVETPAEDNQDNSDNEAAEDEAKA